MARKVAYKKIEVTWLDHFEAHGQVAPLTDADLKPMVWKSTGYLITENDAMIEIARDISVDIGVTDVGASMRIMKSCIVKRSDKKGG